MIEQDANRQAKGNPLFYLVDARLREFCREPAAIFWVYVFPLIMMVALGVAFRNRPPEQAMVDVQAGLRAEYIVEALSADGTVLGIRCVWTIIGGLSDCMIHPLGWHGTCLELPRSSTLGSETASAGITSPKPVIASRPK